MYRIFGFLGIRRVCGISVGIHITRVSIRGGGVMCSLVTVGHSGWG